MFDDKDHLMREVDEELRRDQLKKLWDQYGTYLIAAVAALLLGVGGNQWWQSRKVAAAEAAGQRFEEAVTLTTAGKAEDAQKALAEIAGNSRTAYAALAQLSLAGQATKADKPAEALQAYEAVSKSASDPLLRDFARLQAASLKIDGGDFTDIQNRLNDLIGDKSPWRYTARELLGLAALKAGKLDEAKTTLTPLSADPRAPAAIRERAAALMSLVTESELEKTAPATVELEKTEAPASKGAPPESPGDAAKAGSQAKGPKAVNKK